MSETWNTKYGRRRVRRESPTLEEAIVAARDITDDPEAQAEIASSLMGLPLDEVRAAVMKEKGRRKVTQAVAFTSRGGTSRAVVVERKRTFSRAASPANPVRR